MTNNNIQNTTLKHKDLATQTYKTLHRNKKIQQHKPTKHYLETQRFSNTNLQNTTQKQRFSNTNLQNTTQKHKDLATQTYKTLPRNKDLVTQTYKTLHRNTKIQQHKPTKHYLETKIQQRKPTKHYIETQRFSNTNLQNTTQKHKDLATQTTLTATHFDGERKYKKTVHT